MSNSQPELVESLPPRSQQSPAPGVPHGTWTGYVTHRCRCQECRSHASASRRARARAQASGVPVLVDAAPARSHVASLRAAGMSFRAIALAAGWSSRNSLASSLARSRMHPRTLERILAVRPSSDTRPSSYVDATGSRRRLQALAAGGHSARALAAELGHADTSTVLGIQSGRTQRVRLRTASRICDLFDSWWDKPGDPKVAASARARGWPPALAWDEEDLDDPQATYHKDAVRRPSRRTTPDPRDIAELLSMGWTYSAIAQRFSVTSDTISRVMARYRQDDQSSELS